MHKMDTHTDDHTKKDVVKETIDEREQKVLEFWNTNNIFEKTLEATKDKEPYIFYDGPPFATGLPHYGHLLAGTIKDVIPRYQTMRGRYVRREWGWDCHGLPIENLIEQDLGFVHKKEIEEYGVANFNEKARASVLMYDKEWKVIVPRMGRWVDMEKSYKTMDATYTESIWWAFKTLFNKGLIYEGYKPMHICPRCETTLAASEVAEGYKEVKDISVFVKFALVDEPATFLLAWTTTPWTLPGNVALALGADINYAKFTIPDSEEVYIAANTLLDNVAENYTVLEEFKGSTLVGKSYKPVFDTYARDEELPNYARGWKVYAADFVTTESGTGIVHIAPAFGEDDMELGKREQLPFVQHVRMDGTMKPEVVGFAGMSVKPLGEDKVRLATDIAVLKYLQENGTFFAKKNILHSYPHCWRCKWPLLNYAASSWFVNVVKLKPKLLEENSTVQWVPEHIRDGRFGKWLEGARDWAISRSRYWGAPIPVWKCESCAQVEAIGSAEELKTKFTPRNNCFVMRHGESTSNVDGIVSYKIEDKYPLTEKGRKQAVAGATTLKDKKIDLIIASPVLRTKETAVLVATTLGIDPAAIIYDERLVETKTGDFNGCAIEEYRMFFPTLLEKFTKRPPGAKDAETLEEMKSRIGEFLYAMDAEYHGKNILFVTHEYGAWMMDAVRFGATNEEAVVIRDGEGEDYLKNGEARAFPFIPLPHNDKYELDFHRPHIDAVKFPCVCGKGEMVRVSEVFDCWFESGSMPFAQFHYMGDERTPEGKAFMKNFPANFIAEGLDQTRGWFYTSLILSVGLFDRTPYKSVIVNGLILAEDGQKMSKSLRNYPDPMDIVAKYGADAVRFYMIGSPAVRGEELRFTIDGVGEVFKKITMRLDNVRSFYELYAEGHTIGANIPKSTNVLDRWICARWAETHAEVTHHLDTHELDKATRPIVAFIDDLSTWYLRRSRDRFKSDDVHDRKGAIETTGWILFELAKLLAPFMPFYAEDLYGRLAIKDKKESVHMEGWPTIGVALQTVLEEMDEVRRIVTLALEARAKTGIKVRQPLGMLRAESTLLPGKKELLAIIADEVNVKEVFVAPEIEGVELDTTITEALKAEGQLRDLIRLVQEERKNQNLTPGDVIEVFITTDAEICVAMKEYEEEFKKAVNATTLKLEAGEQKIIITR